MARLGFRIVVLFVGLASGVVSAGQFKGGAHQALVTAAGALPTL